MNVADLEMLGLPHLLPPHLATGQVSTDSGCLIFLCGSLKVEVIEDLLFDGPSHHHVAGGFATCHTTIGRHLTFDGTFPVHLYGGPAGVTTVLIDLHTPHDSFLSPESHNSRDGWSPMNVLPVKKESFIGDAAALLDDGFDGAVRVEWPDDGYVMFSSHTTNGHDDHLLFTWEPAS